jgi:hypothetical protein
LPVIVSGRPMANCTVFMYSLLEMIPPYVHAIIKFEKTIPVYFQA